MKQKHSFGLDELTGAFRFSSDAILVIDGERHILAFNPAAEAMTGWQCQDVVGKTTCHSLFGCSFINSPRLKNPLCPGSQAVEMGEPIPAIPLSFSGRRGQQICAIASYSPIASQRKEGRVVVINLRPLKGQAVRAVPGQVQVKDLRIDGGRREAWLGRRRLELTPVEFDLLFSLASRPGICLGRSDLLKQVWGMEHDPATNLVDVHVKHLRDKLEANPKQPSYIRTVRGCGYRFRDP